jgi:hypothetical protein
MMLAGRVRLLDNSTLRQQLSSLLSFRRVGAQRRHVPAVTE